MVGKLLLPLRSKKAKKWNPRCQPGSGRSRVLAAVSCSASVSPGPRRKQFSGPEAEGLPRHRHMHVGVVVAAGSQEHLPYLLPLAPQDGDSRLGQREEQPPGLGSPQAAPGAPSQVSAPWAGGLRPGRRAGRKARVHSSVQISRGGQEGEQPQCPGEEGDKGTGLVTTLVYSHSHPSPCISPSLLGSSP